MRLISAQFLVDDALQILSSLSNSRPQDTSSSSVFVRSLWKIFDFLKTLSFIKYSSQEEALVFSDTKSENLKRAMELLTKAAKFENSDAIYLLGELNFVHLFEFQ